MAELEEFKAHRHPLRETDHFYSAIVFSLVLHMALVLAWDLNRRYAFLHPDLFKFLDVADPSRLLVKKQEEAPKVKQRIINFKFADVDPSQATTEVPKNAKHYGAVNSKAANEQPTAMDKGQARIKGKQTKTVRLEDKPLPSPPSTPKIVPKPKPKRTVPAKKPAPKQPIPKKTTPTKSQPKPKPPAKPVLKVQRVAEAVIPKPAPPPPPKPVPAPEPAPKPQPDTLQIQPTPKPAPRSRPKTIEEAMMRRAASSGLAGQKMRQDGGVMRKGRGSLDVKGTSYGGYDKILSEAIQQRWYSLIRERKPLPKGMVTVKFRLLHDGRIDRVETITSTVDDLHTVLCQMSVKDPSPYQRWPAEMRRQLDSDFRDITVSFHY